MARKHRSPVKACNESLLHCVFAAGGNGLDYAAKNEGFE
jgi:hypothetical protein